MKKKIIAIAAVAAILLVSIVGTLAYMQAKSNTVKNTFVFGNGITLNLEETGNGTYNAATPGQVFAKDPKVTLGKDSKSCWLFIKIDEENNKVGNKQIITYDVRDEWTALDATNHPGVYYIEYTAPETTPENDIEHYVLTGDENNTDGCVIVNNDLGNTEWNQIVGAGSPSISFTAYAIEHEAGENAAAAWANVDGNTNP